MAKKRLKYRFSKQQRKAVKHLTHSIARQMKHIETSASGLIVSALVEMHNRTTQPVEMTEPPERFIVREELVINNGQEVLHVNEIAVMGLLYATNANLNELRDHKNNLTPWANEAVSHLIELGYVEMMETNNLPGMGPSMVIHLTDKGEHRIACSCINGPLDEESLQIHPDAIVNA